MINCNEVFFKYSSHSSMVISNFNINFEKGKQYGLLGHNGAGKSTIIKLILGLLYPNSGSISYSSSNLVFSYLPETNGLYQKLNCYQNLIFRGSIYSSDFSLLKSKAMFLLEYFGLKDRAFDKVETLSQGMKKRLSLACCDMFDYDVIILDEPTNGLDPESLSYVTDYIDKTLSNNKTLIMCCHDLEIINKICSNIIILDEGSIIFNDILENTNVGGKTLRDFYLSKTSKKFK